MKTAEEWRKKRKGTIFKSLELENLEGQNFLELEGQIFYRLLTHVYAEDQTIGGNPH